MTLYGAQSNTKNKVQKVHLEAPKFSLTVVHKHLQKPCQLQEGHPATGPFLISSFLPDLLRSTVLFAADG